MPIPCPLYNIDDSFVRWWVIHSISFKLGLRYPFSRIVAYALNTFDINLAQVNPNRWQTILCLYVITREHEVYLSNKEMRSMYCKKKKINGFDEEMAYILVVTIHMLHLKLPHSIIRYKNKYFYINTIWSHNFNTIQPRANGLIKSLGSNNKEKSEGSSFRIQIMKSISTL